ncbi:unnamed protein product [Brassicogethes aeneus]|uniref:Succinate dehydrogenase [ubiquinone] cytochrome b small subunit n=1 Tax=Brassicogethes aeneus TaxID=1431903 RepID=A0A9P0AXS6_BRAAE|nr:unnamed protein product [Brassicogethes aeneus]
MALSLIFKNSARTQVLSKLPANLLKVKPVNTRVFSQLLNNANTTKGSLVSVVSKNVIAKRVMSGDHSKLWPIEKGVAIALLGVVPATFLMPNVILDDVFAVMVVMHAHWGFEACAVDYIRPIIFGAAIPKISLGIIYVISALTLGGLIYYNHHSAGIGKTIRRIWELEPKQTAKN